MYHRLPWERLSSYCQCRQQWTQLPRQVAQRTDEGGKLQGHAHEVLASHVFCKWKYISPSCFRLQSVSNLPCLHILSPLHQKQKSLLLLFKSADLHTVYLHQENYPNMQPTQEIDWSTSLMRSKLIIVSWQAESLIACNARKRSSVFCKPMLKQYN